MRMNRPSYVVPVLAMIVGCNVQVNDGIKATNATSSGTPVSTSTPASTGNASATSKATDGAPSASGAAPSSAPPVGSASGSPAAGGTDGRRTVEAFTEVHVSTGLEADIDIGPSAPLEITGDDEIVKVVKTEVSGGILTISLPSGHFNIQKPLKVHVTTPKVTALEAGTSGIIVATKLVSDDLKVEAATSGRVTIAGSCKTLDANVATGSKLDAGALICESAKIDAATGSDATVNATASATGTASTGSHVHVKGSPKEKRIEAATGATVD